ncbi:MAG: hypothetical protein AABX79_02950 [Nanoarchaeota archaeon]
MTSLADCLREVGLFEYSKGYSDEGCKMVSDAVNLALDSHPAVLQFDIDQELFGFGVSKGGGPADYGSITQFGKNKYLRKPKGFHHIPLYDVVKRVVKRSSGIERKIVLRGEKRGGILRHSKVFYRDRGLMEKYIELRLTVKKQTLAELKLA